MSYSNKEVDSDRGDWSEESSDELEEDIPIEEMDENVQRPPPPATQSVGPYQYEPEWQEGEHGVAAPVAEGEDSDEAEERTTNTNW